MQNPLTALEHKAVSVALQKSIVPWLITILGIDYPSNTTADLVLQMVAAISAHCMTPLLMSIPKQQMQLQRQPNMLQVVFVLPLYVFYHTTE